MQYKRVPVEERMQIIEKVNTLQKEGKTLNFALKEVGIAHTSWNYWKGKGWIPGLEPSPVQMIVHRPENASDDALDSLHYTNPSEYSKRTYRKRDRGKGLVLIMGTPEQLAEFYQAVSRE